MKENTTNTEIKNSLVEQGAFAYKIADQPTSWTAHRTRFTPDKPCDIICLYKGKGCLIEGKQMKKFEAFGIRHLRPAQCKAMDEAVAAGNRAFIFLNVRIAKPYENRLIILEWSVVKDQLMEASFKAKEIEQMRYIRGSKGRFDLTEFLREL